jgi:hypothetical protein
MKIIITEEQNRTISDKLKSMVKQMGWKTASKSVGGFRNLIKLGFNDNPMEFLNLFNDLEVTQSKDIPDWTLYRYEKGNNMIIYNRKNDDVYINYLNIWSFLDDGFEFNYSKIQEIITIWLDEVYNLRGVTPSPLSPFKPGQVV